MYAIPSECSGSNGAPRSRSGLCAGSWYGQWIMASLFRQGFSNLDPVGAARRLKQMPVLLETLDLAAKS